MILYVLFKNNLFLEEGEGGDMTLSMNFKSIAMSGRKIQESLHKFLENFSLEEAVCMNSRRGFKICKIWQSWFLINDLNVHIYIEF